MRIIGGQFKGRRFHPPADKWPTRPTTDFAKEGLFNILYNRLEFESIKVLDLFGGTGSHTYELVSRGCKDVTYVDKFSACVKFVETTAQQLDITDKVKIIRADVFNFINHCQEQYDYIFAGPPYSLPAIPTIPDLIFKNNLLKTGGLFVLEHNPHHTFTNHEYFLEERNYGKTLFSFFK